MACTVWDESYFPEAFIVCSGTIVTFQFIPETPMPLLVTAPIIPAIWVPWPEGSSVVSVEFVILTKSLQKDILQNLIILDLDYGKLEQY